MSIILEFLTKNHFSISHLESRLAKHLSFPGIKKIPFRDNSNSLFRVSSKRDSIFMIIFSLLMFFVQLFNNQLVRHKLALPQILVLHLGNMDIVLQVLEQEVVPLDTVLLDIVLHLDSRLDLRFLVFVASGN